MLLGCIADDFTGASDLANTLAKGDGPAGGMATIQFFGVPDGPAPQGCEASVVSLKTRSIVPGEAIRQSLQALDWLKQQGCRQFLFKYCSTFDSTPEGNIGPVAEALLDALGTDVAVVCPVFPATGRTLYMGHLFVGGRLLNESGMEKHPLNPMTDPDIRRWLSLQTRGEVGLVPLSVVQKGPEAVAAACAAEAAAGRRLVVVDAVSDDDLRVIGKAVASHRLVTGGSGIALGLPANFRAQGLLGANAARYAPVKGPGAALSGSCSVMSRKQVAAYSASHPTLAVDPDALMRGDLKAADAVSFVMSAIDREPLVYSTAEPDAVSGAQSRFGREEVASTIERFFGDVAKGLIAAGVRRLAVGGGETSGAVVTAVGIRDVLVGPEIDPGVPALAAEQPHAIRMALKSGNFGGEGFYEKALAALGSR